MLIIYYSHKEAETPFLSHSKIFGGQSETIAIIYNNTDVLFLAVA